MPAFLDQANPVFPLAIIDAVGLGFSRKSELPKSELPSTPHSDGGGARPGGIAVLGARTFACAAVETDGTGMYSNRY